MLQADQDGADSNEVGENNEDEDFGFGYADIFEVINFLEYCIENIVPKKEEDGLKSTEEVIDRLRNCCVHHLAWTDDCLSFLWPK